MLRPIRTRRAFSTLARSGRRGRSGPLWVVVDHPGCDAVEVGFTIGRRVGSAVVRNRIRRRLRALMQMSVVAGSVSPGRYLVGAGVGADELTFDDLRHHLESALSAAGADQ